MVKKAFILAGLLVFSSSLLFAAARRPPEPLTFTASERVSWHKDGRKKRLFLTYMKGQEYVSMRQLARMAGAQLRYQAVSEQACLSRADGTLCFNWNDDSIALNGTPIKNKFPLKRQKRVLYVPLDFVTSRYFQTYSGTEIAWLDKEKKLIQNSPITLNVPRVENVGDRYRFAIDVESERDYQLLQNKSSRIWLRFLKGRSSGSQVLKGDNVVKEVRVVQRNRSADLIVKPGRQARLNKVYYSKEKKKLFIDVFYVDDALAGDIPRIAKKSLSPYKPVSDSSVRTVVIDAGHGGLDSGAIGTRGTMEKDINLKVAKALANSLKREKNLRVILTRSRDEFLKLSERTKIANQAQADLFVSIHCNSSLSSKVSGFEVYFLSPDATDEAAAAVARTENSVVALERNRGEEDDKLSELLASMAVYDFLNESSEASALMTRWVKQKSPVKKTAVKEANFHVLRGAQMPGMLVELGYLSNPISEMKLRSSRYRSKLVDGIKAGILAFDRRARKKAADVAHGLTNSGSTPSQ